MDKTKVISHVKGHCLRGQKCNDDIEADTDVLSVNDELEEQNRDKCSMDYESLVQVTYITNQLEGKLLVGSGKRGCGKKMVQTYAMMWTRWRPQILYLITILIELIRQYKFINILQNRLLKNSFALRAKNNNNFMLLFKS